MVITCSMTTLFSLRDHTSRQFLTMHKPKLTFDNLISTFPVKRLKHCTHIWIGICFDTEYSIKCICDFNSNSMKIMLYTSIQCYFFFRKSNIIFENTKLIGDIRGLPKTHIIWYTLSVNAAPELAYISQRTDKRVYF